MRYEVGDKVKYRCPIKLQANGEIERIYIVELWKQNKSIIGIK